MQGLPQQVVGDAMVQGRDQWEVRTSSEPPTPKPHVKVKQAEVTVPGDDVKNTSAQLAQPLSSVSDSVLEGFREMILEVQSQLRMTESKGDNHTRLTSITGQVKSPKKPTRGHQGEARRLAEGGAELRDPAHGPRAGHHDIEDG